MIPCIDALAIVDVHVHFVRLTALLTWVNDRWSDDHVGTVAICDCQTSDHSPMSMGQ